MVLLIQYILLCEQTVFSIGSTVALVNVISSNVAINLASL